MIKLSLALSCLMALAPAAQEEAAVLDDLSLEELQEKVKTERDEVDLDVLVKITEIGTRESMEAMLAAYETFASVYMRRAAAVRLGDYDGKEDCFEPALNKLVNIATDERARELRSAAIETLGRSRENGKTFLALIVESGAQDDMRERAMELHVRLGGQEDHPWYRKIYERSPRVAKEEAAKAAGGKGKKKKKRKKKGDPAIEPDERKPIVWPTQRLRAIAMKAIIESFKEEELATAVKENLIGEIGREALSELSRRDSDKATDFAKAILERPDFRGTLRAQGAEILVKAEGAGAAKDLIDIATKSTTQAVLQRRIADLLADLKDEKVNKLLAKLVGKGKGPQKAFSIRATKHLDDEKLTKKVRKMLRDKDPMIAIAAIEALAVKRDRESIKDLEKLLGKTKDDDVRQATLAGLSAIYDGENEWVERLVEYGKNEDVDLRNAALIEVARLGRTNLDEIFLAALKHENWSTRLTALGALVARRDADLVKPIVERMQEESGRMAIEFGDALFRLTGESFGKNGAIWARWLGDQTGSINLIDESDVAKIISEEEERRLKQISEAEFFGIRIESHRVLFIIDVSGSMNEPLRARYTTEQGKPRIDVAKEELAKAIKALDDNALFNIAPFSTGVESWLEEGVANAGDATRDDALEYVGRLGALGGTNLYGSLEYGFSDLDVDTIFVLSDGEPSVGDLLDPQLIRDAVKEMNATRKVVIHTISVGGSLEILEWLAADSGGVHVEFQ